MADPLRPTSGLVTLANWQEPPFNRWAFQHIRELIPTAKIARSSHRMRRLPRGSRELGGVAFRVNDHELTVQQFLDQTWTDGFIVLHEGQVVFEQYFNGMAPDTPHLLMSVSKSVTSAVAGVLAGRGVLDVDEQVTRVVPELAGTSFDGATVQHLLDMRAGTRFNEDYDDPAADVRTYESVYLWRPPGPVADGQAAPADALEYFTTLENDGAHGGPFRYRSILTDVLACVIERAAGQRLHELIARELWQPMGAEFDAEITLDRRGNPMADGGICATLRDIARFGQLYLDQGRIGAQQILPRWWIDDTIGGAPDGAAAFLAGDNPPGYQAGSHYRNCWWVRDPAVPFYHASGINGQHVFVHGPSRTVVAKLSTWPVAWSESLLGTTVQAARAIAQALAADLAAGHIASTALAQRQHTDSPHADPMKHIRTTLIAAVLVAPGVALASAGSASAIAARAETVPVAVVRSCTFGGLKAALRTSANVRFGCSGTLTFTVPLTIAGSRPVTIDGTGRRVVFTSSFGHFGYHQLLLVDGSLTLIDVTLEDAAAGGEQGPSGGGGAPGANGDNGTNGKGGANGGMDQPGAPGTSGTSGTDGGTGAASTPGGRGTDAHGGGVVVGTRGHLIAAGDTFSYMGVIGGAGNFAYEGGPGGTGGNGGNAGSGGIGDAEPCGSNTCCWHDGAAGTTGKAGDGGNGGAGGDGGDGGDAEGGAIYSRGSVTLIDSDFNFDLAEGGFGGDGGTGGFGGNGGRGGFGGYGDPASPGTSGGAAGNGADGGDGGSGGDGSGGAVYAEGSLTVLGGGFVNDQAIGGTAGSAGSGGFAGVNNDFAVGGTGGGGGTDDTACDNGPGLPGGDGGDAGDAGDGGNGGAGGNSSGGAVYAAGDLVIVSSTFSGDQGFATNGGQSGAGGNAMGGGCGGMGGVGGNDNQQAANGADGDSGDGGNGGHGGDGGSAKGGAIYSAGIADGADFVLAKDSVDAGKGSAGGAEGSGSPSGFCSDGGPEAGTAGRSGGYGVKGVSASSGLWGTVRSVPVLTIKTTLPGATKGKRYSVRLAERGGSGPVTWLVYGLPAGLSANPVTGLISGTPQAAGSYKVEIAVSRGSGWGVKAATLDVRR